MNNTLGFRHEQLKALREGLGLTQEEFAARVGVSRVMISYWENGEKVPRIDTLLRICNATGAKVDSFFETKSD